MADWSGSGGMSPSGSMLGCVAVDHFPSVVPVSLGPASWWKGLHGKRVDWCRRARASDSLFSLPSRVFMGVSRISGDVLGVHVRQRLLR